MTEDKLTELLNRLNNLASDYGMVVGGYQQEEEQLQLLMVKTLGEDEKNGRIDSSTSKGVAKGN
jgi:hypothetical protein